MYHSVSIYLNWLQEQFCNLSFYTLYIALCPILLCRLALREVSSYIYIFPSFLKGTYGPHKVSPSDTITGEYFDFIPCFALVSNLFKDCSAPCCSGSATEIWFPEDSTLRLLLLCHLVVGEVCGPAIPTSSAEFLVRLAFA